MRLRWHTAQDFSDLDYAALGLLKAPIKSVVLDDTKSLFKVCIEIAWVMIEETGDF